MSDQKIKNMEDFAAVSGLSRPTVSKYFNDPTSVRSSTRDRIEAALAKYDFHPNIYAMNQNRKLTNNVGIVVPYLSDPVFAELARKVEEYCILEGFRPTLFSAHGQPHLEVEILDGLRSLKPSGVLIAPLGRTPNRAVIEKFCNDVPTVLFDSFLPDTGLGFAGSNNPQFAHLIVDYLCRTGEHPSFLEMRTPANPNANRRRQAYIEAMENLGFEPSIVKIDGEGWAFEEIGRSGGGKALLEKQFATNTILCSNDRLAIGFLTACYENQIRVGRGTDCDIRVAGMDDHPFSRFTCPPLTTVAQDFEAVAKEAVSILVASIEGREISKPSTFFDGRLVMRESA
jgi:DNA-binding LacI/PurR family transcriptional regulator